MLVIGQQLAHITWQLLPEKTVDPVPLIARFSIASSQPRSQYSNPLTQLDSLYLFGRPEQIQQKKSDTPVSAPVSRLAAKITGLVASTNSEDSLAIIRIGSEDNTYQIGDTLKGTRAQIESIHSDRVIIRNGERYESLLMYPDETQNKSARRVPANRQSKSRTVASLREKMIQQPDSWSEIISISPVRKDGSLLGYRVNPAQHPEQFTQLGLKPNDMAVAINGYDLTNTAEALKIVAQLPSLIDISLTIERDGQHFEIDLSSS